MRTALVAVASRVYDMEATDPGLRAIDKQIGATAARTAIAASELRDWLRRVTDTWLDQAVAFRLARRDQPSLIDCVRQHEPFLALRSTVAVVKGEVMRGMSSTSKPSSGSSSAKSTGGKQAAKQFGQASKKPAKATKQLLLCGPGVSSSERGEDGAAGEAGDTDQDEVVGAAAGAGREVAQAWPDKPQLSQAKFTEFKQTVQEKAKGSNTCHNFLVGRCFRGTGCKFDHEVPQWFESVKRRFKPA